MPTISMCSASQPSSRAMLEAIRSAKHFFPNSALPPYPEPYDQISRVSGKWTMYFVGLQGHGTSFCPGASGAPTECRQGTTRFPSLLNVSRTPAPMRAMMRMFTTTYGESVSSMPYCAIGDPTGPMQNGSTYMVRPAIDPWNSAFNLCRIVNGSSQLLVGPALTFESEQTNVRDSTRATSLASDRA